MITLLELAGLVAAVAFLSHLAWHRMEPPVRIRLVDGAVIPPDTIVIVRVPETLREHNVDLIASWLRKQYPRNEWVFVQGDIEIDVYGPSDGGLRPEAWTSPTLDKPSQDSR